MTTEPTAHRAVLTVTVETRPDGGHYFDQADFTAHAVQWVRSALKGKHAVDEVTVVDQAVELARAQAEAHQYRTALQGVARRAAVPVPPPTDRTELRDRIRRAVCEAEGFGWDTDMLEPDEYGEVADAVLAVLPEPAADRGAVHRLAADAVRDTIAPADWPADAVSIWNTATNIAEHRLRRLAAEAPTITKPEHACGNCEGIDPDTCLMNPNRPPEQCPNSEFDGYGLQCQKPAGHNLCTFEEQPAAASQPAADGWVGAVELVPDREVQRLAATGLVGYTQDRGRLLHCLHHKPVPASRYVDFQEVTADDLPDGGICVHPRCGADLLAVPAVGVRQDGAQPKPPAVAYRSRDGRSLYCTAHKGELFGLSYEPVTSDDLPDGGICTYPDCGVDILIQDGIR